MRRKLIAVALCSVVFAACSGNDDPSAQEREAKARQDTYERLQSAQPAKSMGYSPTRETINFWIDTWDEPGKLSYVYLQGATGNMLGYYVFEGLPVNYCAALTPTYDFESRDSTDGNADIMVPAPSVDGVYYSGGQCMTYYGKDATSGSYLEYTAGLGINVLVYEQPLPRQDVEPLGFTDIEDIDK